MACSCQAKPCRCGPSLAPPGCNPAGRGPDVQQLPANVPPPVSALACTTAGAVQVAIDSARRVPHALGYRPYRVRLVWQQQNDVTGDWFEAASLELMPVLVSDLTDVKLVVDEGGTTTEGIVTLNEVSPAQVDEYTLRGYRDGEPWGQADPTREFFYEVQQIKWCPGDALPSQLRFVPASRPGLDADNNQWVVELMDQFGERAPDGTDQTTPSDYVLNPAAFVP